MSNIFTFTDPVLYLKEVIEGHKVIRGYHSKLATAAGCQLSYFSQFLRHKVYLSPDHAAGISDFLRHSDLEAEYFLNMLLLSRAATPKLKERLEKKLRLLRSQHESLSGRLQTEKDVETTMARYYSSWLYGAIHMALSCPQFKTVEELALRFGISEEKTISLLTSLEEMGTIGKKDGKWTLIKPFLHLPHDSDMTFMNHLIWRQKGLLDLDKEQRDSVHYASVFSMGEKDVRKLKSMILDNISALRDEIKESPSEEVFCFTLDFFKV